MGANPGFSEPPFASPGRDPNEFTDGTVEDTETENELLIGWDLPTSLEEVTTLPSEEDEFHMIDYLMGHNSDEQ